MISDDAKKRIDFYNRHQSSPVGAYTTNSKGWTFAREAVAKYISNRDGVQADPEHIYLTNGASEGVRLIMSALIRDSNDGMLVPIPQYPLYSALLTLNKAKLLPYYLQEEKNWGLDAEGLLGQITKSIESGITPRAIVVINPGNPTG
jgi:aspartate/methionine/tyrosine aminotransferase